MVCHRLYTGIIGMENAILQLLLCQGHDAASAYVKGMTRLVTGRLVTTTLVMLVFEQ